jgi:predicted TIM-barrel enzyme
MTPISVLKALGLKFKVVFKDAPKVVKVGEEVIVDAQPLVDIALGASLPWLVPLYNEAVALIKASEVASAVATGGASGNGLANAAFVARELEPIALKLLVDHGVSSPTAEQIKMYIDGTVMTMNAFSAKTVPVVLVPVPAT